MQNDMTQGVRRASLCSSLSVSAAFLFRCLLGVTGTLVALSLAGQLMIHWAPDFLGRDLFALQFDVDREQSISTLFSIVLHLGACLSAGLVGWSLWREAQPYALSWMLVSVLFALTMIDEQVGNHERLIEPLRSRFDAGGAFHYAWVIAGIPIAAVLSLALLRPVLSLPGAIRSRVIVAATLFLAGALGAEMAGGAYVNAGNSLHSAGMEVFLHLEEGLEMLGLSTFIYAMLRYRTESFGPFQLTLRT